MHNRRSPWGKTGKQTSFTCLHASMQGVCTSFGVHRDLYWVDRGFPYQIRTSLGGGRNPSQEVTPWFGRPRPFGATIGPLSHPQNTEPSKALGIKHCLHTAWIPWSSGKIIQANQTPGQALANLGQKTHYMGLLNEAGPPPNSNLILVHLRPFMGEPSNT